MKNEATQTTETPMADDRVLTAGNFKPILFSTPMVQAILRGEKTQTRRIIKIDKGEKIEFDNYETRKCFIVVGKDYVKSLKCPYKVGDILWVRETWHPKRHSFPIGLPFEYKATAKEDGNPTDEPWKPSIFMPKEACRIFLKLKNIRIERLNDISENDAIAEGIERWTEERMKSKPTHYKVYFQNCKPEDLISYTSDPIDSYETLWQKINGEKSWAENPFVWVYEFERTDASFACS